MRRTRATLLLVIFLFVAGLSAQDGEVYFSLTSNKTWGPGEKPVISMYANNVDTLEFRVYRVKDPLAFFIRLKDPHDFGGQVPPPPRQGSLIESFHRWKGARLADIRNFFRAQFSPESRHAIRTRQLEAEQEHVVTPQGDTFAQVPILNREQLVKTWRQPASGAQRWHSQSVAVDVKDKGVYVVEATDGKRRAYTFVIITEMAILTKVGSGHALAAVVDRRSGAPKPGVTSSIWLERKEVFKGSTDQNGFLEIKTTEARPENLLVMSYTKDDFAIAAPGTWNLGNADQNNLLGYIYTDRPIYRPGHTMHFKALLRARSATAYTLPKARELPYEIEDPESNIVQRGKLQVSPNGTAHADYDVPVTAALGYYSIVINPGDDSLRAGFEVEEYKKPEYEVKVTPAKKRVLQGQTIQAQVEARYYYGEPVARGKLKYVVHTSRYWFWPRDEDEPAEEGDNEYDYGGDQGEEKTAVLDEEGRTTISIPTEKQGHDVRYRIEARVTDEANREIAGVGWVLATFGSYNLRIYPERWVNVAGEGARMVIQTSDYDSKPVQAPVRLEMARYNSKNEDERVLATAEGRTGPDGKAVLTLPLKEAGSYRVRAFSKTPEGTEVQDSTYLWVTGAMPAWYRPEAGGARIQLATDKKEYAAGDIAKVLVVTGIPDAYVLFTVEGAQLYSQRIVRIQGGNTTIDVPIRPEFAPNFYVGAAYIREGELSEETKLIKVPASQKQMKVEVKASKAQFKPDEPATYTITARDPEGKPVAAEFSLGVVDEAIYAIRPDSAPDMYRFFYGRVYNSVTTDSSLTYSFTGRSGSTPMLLGLNAGRAKLAQVKPGREVLVQPKIRKAFPDTALWLADVKTGANGQATAQLRFPDSLTTWRATVRGITRDTEVGSAVDRTIVRKNLIVRLAVPRFFRQGDEVTVSVLVHNYLKGEKTARISLDVDGLEILSGAGADVPLPSRGDAKLDFRVRPKEVSQVKLLAKGLTNEESDALELTLPVVPFGVKMAVAKSGAISTSTGQAEVELNVPNESGAGGRTIEVTLNNSIAGAVFGALDYLMSYPYGCTEQTMSSFVPNIVAAQAADELKIKMQSDPAELQKKIRAGMERLGNYQHEDGGWGWWQTDDSHMFMTAYVVAGLSQAKDAGQNVNEWRVNRGREWLAKEFPKDPGISADLRAYVVYALALSGDPPKNEINGVWEQRSKLTPYGMALLGLALHRVKDDRVNEIADRLEKSAAVDDVSAFWKVEDDTLMGFHGDTSSEATAFAVKLLANVRPNSNVIAKAAQWLVANRSNGYYWDSTKQTAMVIFGLIDFVKIGGELSPDFSAEVEVNGKKFPAQRFTKDNATALIAPVIHIPAAQVLVGTNKIVVRKKGTGRLYWSARASFYSTAEKITPSGSGMLSISRNYYRLTPIKENNRVKYQLDELNGPVAPGDVIAVRLTVTGGDWRYLLIEDPIPAGMEFVERDNLYELKVRPDWWGYWYTRREFHDDRAALFQSWFSRKQEVLYLLKAVNPGTYRVSPARVEPMYQPQFVSSSDSRTVEVKP